MTRLEHIRQLALTYYMLHLITKQEHYKDKANRVGLEYKRIKAMEIKLAA